MRIHAFALLLSLQPFFVHGWDWQQDPKEVGEMINQRCLAKEGEKCAVAQVVDQEVICGERTTPIRLYVPQSTQQSLSAILLIHGGAWVGGSLDTHDNLARYLCNKASSIVISVGYLNSPEGKFPLPLKQCYDALLWIQNQKHIWGIDTERIAVVGDSAGGNMAAALCLMVRDRKGPPISLQILINPAPDLTGKGSLQPQGDAWDVMRWQALCYVNDPIEVYHPYVSPAVAKDLTQLPPALILLAEKDFLFEDGKRYYERLKEAGVASEFYIQDGIGHLGCDGAAATKNAQESLDQAVAALRAKFWHRE
ncbi:MAG TPA: alpha/beta hydrolase [Rhabdochlamydiaceae bacterium]|nr:alpha/beta hydrolase [Rhabdochlamydiaceae bacterium]